VGLQQIRGKKAARLRKQPWSGEEKSWAPPEKSCRTVRDGQLRLNQTSSMKKMKVLLREENFGKDTKKSRTAIESGG